MGIEPISQPMPTSLTATTSVDVLASSSPVSITTDAKQHKMEYKPEQLATLLAASQQQQQQQQAHPGDLAKTVAAGGVASVNGATAAMYRQAFQQNPAAVFAGAGGPGILQGAGGLAAAAAAANGQVVGGPGGGADPLKKPPLLNHKLNGTEMAAVRQLITGYRESAAFLLRSADELENLLQIQPKL